MAKRKGSRLKRPTPPPQEAGVGSRIAHWWSQQKASIPEGKAVFDLIDGFAMPGVTVGRIVVWAPVVLAAVLLFPFIGATVWLSHRKGAARHFMWLFAIPTALGIYCARFLGWVLLCVFVWRYVVDSSFREDAARVVKLLTGSSLLIGIVAIVNVMCRRLTFLLERWGLPRKVADKIAMVIGCLIILISLIIFGLVVGPPE